MRESFRSGLVLPERARPSAILTGKHATMRPTCDKLTQFPHEEKEGFSVQFQPGRVSPRAVDFCFLRYNGSFLFLRDDDFPGFSEEAP